MVSRDSILLGGSTGVGLVADAFLAASSGTCFQLDALSVIHLPDPMSASMNISTASASCARYLPNFLPFSC